MVSTMFSIDKPQSKCTDLLSQDKTLTFIVYETLQGLQTS